MPHVPAAAVPQQEVPVSADLVAGLLADQHPDLLRRELGAATAGWDNAVFRLGADLCVRLPRRALAAPLLLKELDVVPAVAGRLAEAGVGVALPLPVRRGRPGRGYPWDWSVCTWAEGLPALELPPAARGPAAAELGRFLQVLHMPAPEGAPGNPFRDGGLDSIDAAVRSRLARLEGRRDAAALARLWEHVRRAVPREGPRRWIHGDLHPGNVLLAADGGLRSVLDFGDACAGDPAVDLASAWQFFGRGDRAAFTSQLAAAYDADCWLRAAGWALHFGLLAVATEGTERAFARNGEATLAALLEDFAP